MRQWSPLVKLWTKSLTCSRQNSTHGENPKYVRIFFLSGRKSNDLGASRAMNYLILYLRSRKSNSTDFDFSLLEDRLCLASLSNSPWFMRCIFLTKWTNHPTWLEYVHVLPPTMHPPTGPPNPPHPIDQILPNPPLLAPHLPIHPSFRHLSTSTGFAYLVARGSHQ